VHVGGCQGNVPQGWSFETAHILGIVGDFVNARVIGRVGSLGVEIVKSSVVEGDFRESQPLMLDGVAEDQSTVAMEALHPLTVEQGFPPLCRIGNGGRITAVTVTVVGGVEGEEGALKGGDRQFGRL